MEGTITSSFGTRINPVLKREEFHDGIDIAVPDGTEVKSIYNGKVLAVGESETFGKFVEIKLDNNYKIKYAHLSEVLVSKNDIVYKNDVVALSGKTGLTTGAHLHYSLWNGETLIDPFPYLDLAYTEKVVAEYASRGEKID